MDHDAGRVWHYRDFYRPDGTPPPGTEPLWLVWGNCQAEALRRVLDAVPARPYRTARIPPVHELTGSDMRHLDDLLANTAVLLSQPVRPGYRNLPIGTADIAARLPPAARVLRWPVIRYAGLYPFQVIVRHPADRSVDPPVVPYHDLRTIAAARAGAAAKDEWQVEVSAEQFRAVAAAGIEELARRESQCDVGVSDLLMGHGAGAVHAINHPGNPVFDDLASRILAELGVAERVSPISTTLLGSVYAPLEQRVLDALGLDAPARDEWMFHGSALSTDRVHRAQLTWYADNPDYLDLAVTRHGATMRQLDLLPDRVAP